MVRAIRGFVVVGVLGMLAGCASGQVGPKVPVADASTYEVRTARFTDFCESGVLRNDGSLLCLDTGSVHQAGNWTVDDWQEDAQPGDSIHYLTAGK